MADSHKKLRCLITAAMGVDLSSIIQVLLSKRIEIIDPYKDSNYGLTMSDIISIALKDSDFVVAVLSPNYKSDNVIFEAGYATALGKPVLLAASGPYDLPSSLKNLLYVGSINPEAISFAVDQILENLKEDLREPQRTTETQEKSLGNDSNGYLAKINQIFGDSIDQQTMPLNSMKGVAFENLLREVLEKAGISIKAKTEIDDDVDLAVWSKQLDPYFGNPILIEPKLGPLSDARIAIIREHATKHLQNSNAGLVVVFYLGNQKFHSKLENDWHPTVYFFEFTSFLQLLSKYTFSQIIIRERNRRVHGVG